MSYHQKEVKPIGGFYPQTKVYSDGSHYIAIPHTEKPYKPRKKPIEEVITVKSETAAEAEETPSATNEVYEQNDSAPSEKDDALIGVEENQDNALKERCPPDMPQLSEKKITKKQLFEELYKENLFLRRRERREQIITAMRPYFDNDEKTQEYVDRNLERKLRNLIARRIRLTRKANLQDFNYFVTFTYDNALHSEDSFKKKLKSTLGHFSSRKGWKYIGVWERSPKKQRLHFHGIFHIPEETMPGSLIAVTDYNVNKHMRVTTMQNTYFNEKFGRSDFEKIEENGRLGEALAYIMKYIEKSGEKIVYSKGLPQYFISDIYVDDIVCKIGIEDSKLLLFDDFRCWDEGVLIGKVNEKETINQLKKSN